MVTGRIGRTAVGIRCLPADLDHEAGKARDEETSRKNICEVPSRLGSDPRHRFPGSATAPAVANPDNASAMAASRSWAACR